MNSSHDQKEPFTRWYQESWSLYIVGVIIVTVVWSTFKVYFAFTHADEVVVDDYYKVGKAINQDLSRDRRAEELKMAANIVVNEQNMTVKVELNSDLTDWPQQLRLRLIPAALRVEKQTIALLQAPSQDNLYSGSLTVVPAGRYYLQLETLDELTPEKGFLSGWRLNREVHFNSGMAVELTPAQ